MQLATLPRGPFAGDEVQRLAAERCLIEHHPIGRALVELGEPAVVLNRARQVVLANHPMARLIGSTPEEMFRHLIGDLLGCHSTRQSPYYCGAGSNCRHCGLFNAILVTLRQGVNIAKEIPMELANGGEPTPIDLAAWTFPVNGLAGFMVLVLPTNASLANLNRVEGRIAAAAAPLL